MPAISIIDTSSPSKREQRERIGMDMDRRSFLVGSLTACGGVAALAGLSGCSTNDGTKAADGGVATSAWDEQADVLILGGGLSGVIAGYVATQAGASVIIAEAGSELGGTLLISGGGMHTMTMETPEDVATMCPTGDQKLLEKFMTEWVDFRDTWLEETGAPNAVHNPMPGWNTIMIGTDYATRKEFIDFFGNSVIDAGSKVMLDTRAIELCMEGQTITGAVVTNPDNTRTTIGAKATILATGGFAANPAMRRMFLGRYGDQLAGRSVPYNQGDGHIMALRAGGQLTRGLNRFYGHLTPYPSLIPADKATYDAMSKDDLCTLLGSVQLFEPLGIVVNRNGMRFEDEASTNILPSGMDCSVAEQMAEQALGVGYVIVDSNVENIADTMASLVNFGAVVDQADTLEELSEKLAARGVHAPNFLKTVKRYNESDPSDLEIPQSRRSQGDAQPLTAAPFYSLQVTGACSAMFGGVKIDEDGRVLGEGDAPIPGLYATACCAGGFGYNEYMGSIALTAVYGKIASETALADLQV